MMCIVSMASIYGHSTRENRIDAVVVVVYRVEEK